eukprot:scaffold664_cov79-Phaeocystis_antarctica.AAC.3
MRESSSIVVPLDTRNPPPSPIVAWQRRMAMRVNVCVPPSRLTTANGLAQSEMMLSTQVLEPDNVTAPPVFPIPPDSRLRPKLLHLANRTRLACSIESPKMAPP